MWAQIWAFPPYFFLVGAKGYIDREIHQQKLSWLSGWRGDMRILCPRHTGLILVAVIYLIWPGVIGVTVCSARVAPVLNG